MKAGMRNMAVIGASGALGGAFAKLLCERHPGARLHAFSRKGVHRIDYADEQSILAAAELCSREKPLDLVIVASGFLHDAYTVPEKSLRELSARNMRRLFEANAIAPALVAKHFLPRLDRQGPSVFAALSARVGSISDNRIGGWHSYRASKSALNMIVRNAAIETARHNKQAVVVALHPGTVDSDLSRPYQSGVPEGGLFEPEHAARRLIDVLERLTPDQSGKCFAWDGCEIPP